MKSHFRALKQQQLDTVLQRWKSAGLPVRPSIGWIKAIREALGMPAAYLAKKMGMTHSSLLRLESSEADDGITLGRLRWVAEALDCELQYALAPRKALTETLEAQATKLAQERTQGELNEWEQLNILQGEAWAQKQQRKDLLDEGFARQLHKQMFNETWKWAGSFRKSDKNIGVDWRKIGVRLKDLFADVRYQIDNDTFTSDEIAVRFHHRLVSIHPFPNGNGRHARLMADLLVTRLNPRFRS